MKKRALIICFCILLLTSLTIFAIAVNADSRSYEIDADIAEIGTEFSVPVSIKNNSGIVSLRFRIIFDEEVLELIDVSDSALLNGYTEPSPDYSSPYNLRWADALAENNNTENGEIAVITFKAKEDAQASKTTITIEHIEARAQDGTFIDFSDTDEMLVLSSTHSFTYYISDNNATCTKDGTKTAYCDYGCGQSDTQIDKNTAFGHRDANEDKCCDNCEKDLIDTVDCDHFCHRTGILGFIAKLVAMIWKLFKINPVCECGVAHY